MAMLYAILCRSWIKLLVAKLPVTLLWQAHGKAYISAAALFWRRSSARSCGLKIYFVYFLSGYCNLLSMKDIHPLLMVGDFETLYICAAEYEGCLADLDLDAEVARDLLAQESSDLKAERAGPLYAYLVSYFVLVNTTGLKCNICLDNVLRPILQDTKIGIIGIRYLKGGCCRGERTVQQSCDYSEWSPKAGRSHSGGCISFWQLPYWAGTGWIHECH